MKLFFSGSKNTSGFRVADNAPSDIVPEERITMPVVLAERHDFQICEPVIGLDPIPVVDRQSGRDADESFGNHAVGITHELFAAPAQNMLSVSVAFVNVPTKRHPQFPALITDDPANVSSIAHFVEGKAFHGLPPIHVCHLNTEAYP